MSSTKNKINPRTLILIDGYVRLIDNIKQIVPSSIIDIIIKFYNASSKIIFISDSGSWSGKPPIISIVDLDTNANYECKIKPLDIKNKPKSYQASSFGGILYCSDFPLPPVLQKLNTELNVNNLYDVIFVVQTGNYQTGAYIIDLTQHQ